MKLFHGKKAILPLIGAALVSIIPLAILYLFLGGGALAIAIKWGWLVALVVGIFGFMWMIKKVMG